jgi:hypothetical protein
MLLIFNSANDQVIHSARANASHNHGLDLDRLIVGMSIFLFLFFYFYLFIFEDRSCVSTETVEMSCINRTI